MIYSAAGSPSAGWLSGFPRAGPCPVRAPRPRLHLGQGWRVKGQLGCVETQRQPEPGSLLWRLFQKHRPPNTMFSSERGGEHVAGRKRGNRIEASTCLGACQPGAGPGAAGPRVSVARGCPGLSRQVVVGSDGTPPLPVYEEGCWFSKVLNVRKCRSDAFLGLNTGPGFPVCTVF